MELEQALDRREALEDALGVVHAVHADQKQNIVGQLLDAQDLGPAQRHGELTVDPLRRPLNRDRVMLDARELTTVEDGGRLALDARLQVPVDRLDEILAVEARVEAEDRAA